MRITNKGSGNLAFVDYVIRYTSPTGATWGVSASDLLVFGEYTNPLGPLLDDYFFVFITCLGKSYAAPFYSDGRTQFLNALGAHLGMSFECKLVRSTEFASNVLWPGDVAGKPLYEFCFTPAKSIGEKVLRWFGFAEMNTVYSPQVLAKLNRHKK